MGGGRRAEEVSGIHGRPWREGLPAPHTGRQPCPAAALNSPFCSWDPGATWPVVFPALPDLPRLSSQAHAGLFPPHPSRCPCPSAWACPSPSLTVPQRAGTSAPARPPQIARGHPCWPGCQPSPEQAEPVCGAACTRRPAQEGCGEAGERRLTDLT